MDGCGGGYSEGFDGGMGYSEVCIPMDNVGFSGSEVIGNQLPSMNVSEGETTADISYIHEDVNTDFGDIKMPKIKFKQAKPKMTNATSLARRSSSNHGGTISMVIGGLVGLGIFLIIYFTAIKD